MTDLINAFFQFLQQLILPNWPDLIALLPWVLVAIVILSLFGFVLAWGARRRATGRAYPSVAGRAAARRPPAGSVTLAVRRADRRGASAFRIRSAAQGRVGQCDRAVQPSAFGARPDRGADRHRRLAVGRDARMARDGAASRPTHGTPAGASAAAALVPAPSARLGCVRARSGLRQP